jgi:leucyl-tRNA synthetase
MNYIGQFMMKNKLKKVQSNIVIQINGKKRGLINTKLDLEEVDLFKLVKKDQNIYKYISDKEIKKKIYIKNKLMNIII